MERGAPVAACAGRERRLERRCGLGSGIPVRRDSDIDMNTRMPRVAYFPDSFPEVNGGAQTSRHFEAVARRRNLPFLCVRAGDRTQAILEEGNVWTLELPRGVLSFALEKDRYEDRRRGRAR